MKRKPEKSQACRDSSPGLCDTRAALAAGHRSITGKDEDEIMMNI